MAEISIDAQLESLFSRLDAQLKLSQYKKALKSCDDSKCRLLLHKIRHFAA